MKNLVIITAKGGNTTVENKNIIPVLGNPVMVYPIRAAKMASKVEQIYVSTEDAKIADISRKEGVEVLERPLELSQSTSLHKDVIQHCVRQVVDLHPDAENFIVLLGNTVQVTPQNIDLSLEMLESGECDSVATVWQAQDDHPYRALKVGDDGFAESFHDLEVGSNRQSYPTVYYYDQGIWAFKRKCAEEMTGPSPWVWLGKRCKLIERPWVTGRDIHSWIDVSASAWYLSSIQCSDLSPGKVVS